MESNQTPRGTRVKRDRGTPEVKKVRDPVRHQRATGANRLILGDILGVPRRDVRIIQIIQVDKHRRSASCKLLGGNASALHGLEHAFQR